MWQPNGNQALVQRAWGKADVASGRAAEPKFCRALNEGRPSSPNATTSPSMTVLSGIDASPCTTSG